MTPSKTFSKIAGVPYDPLQNFLENGHFVPYDPVPYDPVVLYIFLNIGNTLDFRSESIKLAIHFRLRL